MTDKQVEFVNAYLGQARMNATVAARMAGYSQPHVKGSQLKADPEIRAAIDARIAENTIAANESLSILSQQACGTLAHFVSQQGREVVVDLSTPDAVENFHLLKKVKTKRRVGGKDENRYEEVETEIELHDPQAAAVHMGRHYKLFTDRAELAGDPDKPIVVKTLNNVSRASLHPPCPTTP